MPPAFRYRFTTRDGISREACDALNDLQELLLGQSGLSVTPPLVSTNIGGTPCLTIDLQLPFPARIDSNGTDGSGKTVYGWTEMIPDVGGAYIVKPGGRVGTTTDTPAYEANYSSTVGTNTIVEMREAALDTTGTTGRQYVFDQSGGGIAHNVLDPCVAASDSNISSLTGTTTIDGVSVAAGQRVLLTGQSTASQNGVWVIGTPWTRPADYPSGGTALPGLETSIGAGTVYQGTRWVFVSTTSAAIDSTSTTWSLNPASATRPGIVNLANNQQLGANTKALDAATIGGNAQTQSGFTNKVAFQMLAGYGSNQGDGFFTVSDTRGIFVCDVATGASFPISLHYYGQGLHFGNIAASGLGIPIYWQRDATHSVGIGPGQGYATSGLGLRYDSTGSPFLGSAITLGGSSADGLCVLSYSNTWSGTSGTLPAYAIYNGTLNIGSTTTVAGLSFTGGILTSGSFTGVSSASAPMNVSGGNLTLSEGNGITNSGGSIVVNAGAGLTFSGGALVPSVDGSTIVVSGGNIGVPAGGIGTTQLANGSVTVAKLATTIDLNN